MNISQHMECCSIYFNSIVFDIDNIRFNIDIVHNLYHSRIKNITIDFPLNFITLFDKDFQSNLLSMINMGCIEEGKAVDLKFMSNIVREKHEKLVKIFTTKFKVVSDNTIILKLQ